MAPMKEMTVEKLELQASLFVTLLKNSISVVLTVIVNQVFIRTESPTVLQWIISNEQRTIFVANQV